MGAVKLEDELYPLSQTIIQCIIPYSAVNSQYFPARLPSIIQIKLIKVFSASNSFTIVSIRPVTRLRWYDWFLIVYLHESGLTQEDLYAFRLFFKTITRMQKGGNTIF